MIRRWSYLNALNWIDYPKLFKINRKIRFRLFKFNVKFKHLRKLKGRLTLLKRRPFQSFQPSSKFIIFIKIFNIWAKDYQVTQNLIKFEYVNNIFLMSYLIYDGSSANASIENIGYNVNFLVYQSTQKSNLAILPIRTLYAINKESNLAFLARNKSVRFAWSDENFADFDESLYHTFFLHNDFTFFNSTSFIDTASAINEYNSVWWVLSDFILNTVLIYQSLFNLYTKHLVCLGN